MCVFYHKYAIFNLRMHHNHNALAVSLCLNLAAGLGDMNYNDRLRVLN